MIEWKCTKEETELAMQIAKRAVAIADEITSHHFHPSSLTLTIAMDIEAVHSSNPLRLKDLLEADDTDFAHDVYGIGRNINRTTGELENCFLPRYSC